MIPVEQNRKVTSSGVEGTASFEISGKDAAHIMTILRDTLYSDKVLAVLREYAANAWDANRMAGRADLPIEVTLPTYGDSTLKVRDRGPGLSHADVFEVFNKYGASTKRDSNEAVGMLGIGSKSGFAYSDSFTVVSWHGGKVATYVAVIDASEKGRLDLLDVQDSADPAETGVEIQIAVKPQDIQEFERKAKALFAFFQPQPKINTALPPMPKGKMFDGVGLIIEERDSYGGYNSSSRGWTAVMGCVPYRVNLGQLTGLSRSANNVSGILWFEIGQLQVAASREELKYGDTTKENLVERINTLIDKYVEHLLEGVDKLNQWERRLRVRKINDMHLPVPVDLKTFSDSNVTFEQSPHFKLKHKGYKGKIEGAYGFRVESTTRLVFRNEKRLLQGYAFQEGDVIVDPTLDELAARRALKESITKHRVEGIPMTNISTLSWTRPVTQAGRPIDHSRAKAQCLVLDPKNIHTDRKSERWTPVTRAQDDTDVYVVLESYAANSFADFYETYENDRILLESVGGQMPPVIGYRHTQAHPVDKSKLKGTDYRVWRDGPYVKMILKQPGMETAVAAKFWNEVSAYGYMAGDFVTKLGADHILTKYAERVYSGKKEFQKVSGKHHHAVSRVYNSILPKDNVALQEWEKIVAVYPLLKVQGRPDVSFLSSAYSSQWIEYIKMVDLHSQMDDLVKKVKAQEGQEKEIAA